jgi:UDP-N-acetylmuramyl pentapeptide phosphotransferase/UDP-N-acetylglucosamine-1-phosphate transferase
MLAALLISAVVTRIAIGYAHRRRLIDQPGARRSHSEPTPRGGGIGIVIAVLACACVPALFAPGSSPDAAIVLSVAVIIVAAVGWIDDHRGLSARWRFAAHCLAAAVFLLPVLVPVALMPAAVEESFSVSATTVWVLLAVALLAIVWCINLHNFMDGIDGILAAQAIFVFGALTILCARAGWTTHVGQTAVFAAATAGFLPFNFPRARIFMGDVGSGVLGLLIAAAVLWQMATTGVALASGLILCSAFVTDASCTLLSRMLRGRRWYSAHREHLYQWLARSGRSHAGVVALYMGWNLVIVVPVVCWINRRIDPQMLSSTAALSDSTPTPGWAAAAAVYLLGAAVWFLGKRHCLHRPARQRVRHAAA